MKLTRFASHRWLGRPVLGRPVLGRPVLGRTALSRTALGRTALGRIALGALAAVALCSASVPAASARGEAQPDVAQRGQPVAAPVGSTATSTATSTAAGQTLRALAARQHLRVGTAVDTDALAADAPYRDKVGAEFSTVTPENVMKWGPLEPVRGQPDYTAADGLVAFARQHGQLVRGHTLVWHNQLPSWLTAGVADGSIDATALRQILRQHIFDVARHFRGKIWQWDVVNEAIDDSAQPRQTLWLQLLGPGYIADAFRWAHQADPHALLFYNDYNIEGVNAKSDATFALVQQLRREGVPIHGVGVQGHFGVQFGLTTASDILTNLQRFERLGLATAVTEADVRMPLPADNFKVQAQAQGYNILLQACLLARRCLSVTVWGFTDKYSWVPGVFAGQGSATLFTEQFQPKPAYDALRTDLALANGVPPQRR
jgi:endo-1,4-beta-xylanase